MDMVKQYPELKANRSIEEYVKEDDDQVPRFLADFQKVHKKYYKLKCQCPEGLRLVKEYEEAKETFDKLKEDFAQNKLAQSLNFSNLAIFNEKLMLLSLDFESEELTFRQDIWHQRIAFLLKEMNEAQTDTRINSE